MDIKKERAFSGVQPSGKLHIGNYLGAIKQFVALQDKYETFYCVVDEHAITVPQDPKELHHNTLAIAMAYLAAGIDPKKSVIFVQSHIPAHTELGWILNTMTPLGELERMTQFKEKGRIKGNPEPFGGIPGLINYVKHLQRTYQLKEINESTDLSDLSSQQKVLDVLERILMIFTEEKKLLEENMNIIVEFSTSMETRQAVDAGLLNYPTLMAADILLYHAAVVPVGEDQVQHIELTRSIAKRFNNRFGDTFIIPKVLLQKTSARVMALDEPTKKMSKSATSEQGYIALSDTPDQIRKKIKTSTTDSGKEIHYDPETKPGISNLLGIAAEFSGKSIKELEKEFSGMSYAPFKEAVAEYIISGLASFQRHYAELEKNQDEVLKILYNGKERAAKVADTTLRNVKEKMGFLL